MVSQCTARTLPMLLFARGLLPAILPESSGRKIARRRRMNLRRPQSLTVRTVLHPPSGGGRIPCKLTLEDRMAFESLVRAGDVEGCGIPRSDVTEGTVRYHLKRQGEGAVDGSRHPPCRRVTGIRLKAGWNRLHHSSTDRHASKSRGPILPCSRYGQETFHDGDWSHHGPADDDPRC